MAHRLNTNKQFMVGNGILAFAVIIVVVAFVYMSMREQQKQKEGRTFLETYSIVLEKGFAGRATSIYLNDSLLVDTVVTNEPLRLQVNRLDEQNALMIVDNETEQLALFELSQQGGEYRFEKDEEGVKQLAKQNTQKQVE